MVQRSVVSIAVLQSTVPHREAYVMPGELAEELRINPQTDRVIIFGVVDRAGRMGARFRDVLLLLRSFWGSRHSEPF